MKARRDKSKRASGYPEQAAAIPFRRSRDTLQVCLIRKKKKGWGIPKGFVDPGDTHAETALLEAREEAGLKGRLVGKSIGRYKYEKWSTTLTVAVYLMEVVGQQNRWQEAKIRERRWISLRRAVALLSDHPVRPLLRRAQMRLADRVA